MYTQQYLDTQRKSEILQGSSNYLLSYSFGQLLYYIQLFQITIRESTLVALFYFMICCVLKKKLILFLLLFFAAKSQQKKKPLLPGQEAFFDRFFSGNMFDMPAQKPSIVQIQKWLFLKSNIICSADSHCFASCFWLHVFNLFFEKIQIKCSVDSTLIKLQQSQKKKCRTRTCIFLNIFLNIYRIQSLQRSLQGHSQALKWINIRLRAPEFAKNRQNQKHPIQGANFFIFKQQNLTFVWGRLSTYLGWGPKEKLPKRICLISFSFFRELL
eukprot:TRINITY_DN3338_c1_g1_i1.p2 TRINITY_DN3338_c1_g1~~TRINITY_DN3338_c1_g1_i1.p2  ORF type:complete len:270 (-),score=-8.98 TRINITY_DN3338_c1_g1_i1:679-1488(-)